MNIGLLISGKLGYEILTQLFQKYHIDFVATDRGSIDIIRFSNIQGIPLYVGNPRNEKLSKFCKEFGCDVLLSVNYLFIIEEDVISLFAYPINFHGSLLPRYRGRTPHVWAIINNEIETGVTAHFIDKGCDTGDIILQKKVEICSTDTGNSILNKYNVIYPYIVDEVLNLVSTKKIIAIQQDNDKATYYGKRSPEDGQINWNWQKERINNWVRALSYPYPGAFTFVDGRKIIIDSIEYSDNGYNNDVPNGTILKGDPYIIVKTSNGAVKLTNIRNKELIDICLKDKILTDENK